MYNLLGCVLMAGVTFPVSFFVARTCLNGVLRAMTGSNSRDVL
jgi:hypothetical protein